MPTMTRRIPLESPGSPPVAIAAANPSSSFVAPHPHPLPADHDVELGGEVPVHRDLGGVRGLMTQISDDGVGVKHRHAWRQAEAPPPADDGCGPPERPIDQSNVSRKAMTGPSRRGDQPLQLF